MSNGSTDWRRDTVECADCGMVIAGSTHSRDGDQLCGYCFGVREGYINDE